MKGKGEVLDLLLRYIKHIEKETGSDINAIQMDGGLGFSRALEYLNAQEVATTITAAYMPNSNGMVERTHGIILLNARACISEAKLLHKY